MIVFKENLFTDAWIKNKRSNYRSESIKLPEFKEVFNELIMFQRCVWRKKTNIKY